MSWAGAVLDSTQLIPDGPAHKTSVLEAPQLSRTAVVMSLLCSLWSSAVVVVVVFVGGRRISSLVVGVVRSRVVGDRPVRVVVVSWVVVGRSCL